MPKPKIPGGITPDDFSRVRNLLLMILDELRVELEKVRAKPQEMTREVHLRLNETGKSFPLPIFVGWVEDSHSRQKRMAINRPDPGLYRFGDDVLSEIYGEAFRFAFDKRKYFRDRNWEEKLWEKRPAEKAVDPKAGNMYQTCLGIVVEEGNERRCVGTLVIGFLRKPRDSVIKAAQKVIGKWARDPNSALVRFLKGFELGGPTPEMIRFLNQKALIWKAPEKPR